MSHYPQIEGLEREVADLEEQLVRVTAERDEVRLQLSKLMEMLARRPAPPPQYLDRLKRQLFSDRPIKLGG